MEEFESNLRAFFEDQYDDFLLPELFKDLVPNCRIPCLIIVSDDGYFLHDNNGSSPSTVTLDEIEEYLIDKLIDMKPTNKPWAYLELEAHAYKEQVIQIILLLNSLNIGFVDYYGQEEI